MDIVALEALPQTLHGSVPTEAGGETHYWLYNSPDPSAAADPVHEPPHVALIMGLSGTHYAWEAVILNLARDRGCRVLAVDNRGVGRSRETPGPYTIGLMARDTREALRHVGWWPADDAAPIPEGSPRVHVVGISMGGMIAQELVLLCPAAVESVALLATHAGGGLFDTMPSARVLKAFATMFLTRIPQGSEREARVMAQMLHTDKYLAENGPAVYAGITRLLGLSPRVTPTATRAQLAAVRGHRTRERLVTLRGGPRAAVFVGADDGMIPPKNSRIIADALQCPLHVGEGLGHGLVGDWLLPRLWDHICPPAAAPAASQEAPVEKKETEEQPQPVATAVEEAN